MAGDAVIGALRIFLGMDTGQLEDGLKRSSSALSKFARDAAAVGVGVELGKAIEKVVEGFGHLIKASIETADNMGKLSQKIGIPVESLSSLQVAAKLSDVGVEQLGKAIGRLDKEMVAAAAGGTSAAAAALKYLGVTTKDLQGLNAEKTFGIIAESISKMEDGANKTAVVMAIFGGRMGKEIIPLLNMGAKGFEEMARTATALGLVISTQTAKQAEKFNDNLKLMGLAVQGVGLTVASYFLPSMAKSSDAMVKWIVDGNFVTKTAEIIVRAIMFLSDNMRLFGIVLATIFGKAILQAIASFGLAFISLGKAILVSAAASIVMASRFLVALGAIALVGAAVLAVTGQLDGFVTAIENLSNTDLSVVGKGFEAALEAMGIKLKAITGPLEGFKNSTSSLADVLNRLKGQPTFNPNAAADAKKISDEMEKLALRTREAGGEFDHLAPGFVQAAIHMGLLKEGAVGFTGAMSQMTPQMIALNVELAKFKLNQIKQENLTPWQLYEQQLARLGAVFTQVRGHQDLFVIETVKAAAKLHQTYAELAADFLGGFTSLFQALGTENKKMFQIGQAFAIAQALISTYAGAAKALAIYGPTPLGFAMMASAIAAGIAQVIKIKQQKFTGAAMGGTFMVPGGSMGVDTKMVSMALAPGELVEVTPAARAGAAENGYLELSPIRPKDFFTGDVVREMVFSIDQWMRDGGTGVRFANR